MLRLYKPISKDKIFELHKILKYLIFNIWCKADTNDWKNKTNHKRLNKILHYSVKKNGTFENEIERIYNIFNTLSDHEKKEIKKAWKVNNNIEKLCDKTIIPIYLKDLHSVVKKDIKPLFSWCYEYLLNQTKSSGDKLKYYNKLISLNQYKFCPCCGLVPFESIESKYREDYDHYIPKAIFPFASVNFNNLVPICSKCNSDRKSTKDPIEKDKVAFYPFSENNDSHNISIEFEIDDTKDLDKLERKDLKVILTLTKKDNEVKTWNWLFDIKERYNDYVRGSIKTFLREVKSIHRIVKKRDPNITYNEIIDDLLIDYTEDKFTDARFLKKAFLEVIKKKPDFLDVYNDNTRKVK